MIYLHSNLDIFSKTNQGHDKNEREKSFFEDEILTNSVDELNLCKYSKSPSEGKDKVKNFKPVIKFSASLGASEVVSIEEEDEEMTIKEGINTNDHESKHKIFNTNDDDDHSIEANSNAHIETKLKTDYR